MIYQKPLFQTVEILNQFIYNKTYIYASNLIIFIDINNKNNIHHNCNVNFKFKLYSQLIRSN